MNSALFQLYVAPGNTFEEITGEQGYTQSRSYVLETQFQTFQSIVDRDRTVSHVLNPAHVHFNR